MTSPESSKFSVLGTHVAFSSDGNQSPWVDKFYTPNIDLGISLETLKAAIDTYIDELTQAGVPIPKVLDSGIKANQLYYRSEAKGKNIIELGFTPENASLFSPHFEAMLGVIQKAHQAGVAFDPHPKNFVFENDQISYVDFYPPYGDRFDGWRLAQVTSEEEREIVSLNLSYFRTPHLAQHFCGDFLNIDRGSNIIFEQLYELAKKEHLFTGTFSEFEKQARTIRALEDRRIAAKIFLV
jgi:hypothetical protein